LRHSDGRVRIWRKHNENMDPSCLVTTVQADGGGVMVWGMFSWHTLGPLVPIGHCLNATAYLSIVSDHVHPFMATMYPSPDSYFQQDNSFSHPHSGCNIPLCGTVTVVLLPVLLLMLIISVIAHVVLHMFTGLHRCE